MEGDEVITEGMAVVIRSYFRNCVEDISPMNERIMEVTIKGAVTVIVIPSGIPPAQ